MRGALAIILALILAVEVSVSLAFIILSRKNPNDQAISAAKDIIAMILNPTIALVGAVTGFYYGRT